MAVTAKRFEYALELDASGRAVSEKRPALEIPDSWSPEHLVLAALVRCTLTSLRYHAKRVNVAVPHAAGEANGEVTKRDEDGRYAFVSVDCRLEVELDPELPPAERDELIAKAERDCFSGASLTVTPGYRWRVNGADAR